ncbi:hypothetical protein SPAN111604_00750 [Sphingomonas antarctica]
MTAGMLYRPQALHSARTHQIYAGNTPTRMPPGSALHAPFLVGNKGDVT